MAFSKILPNMSNIFHPFFTLYVVCLSDMWRQGLCSRLAHFRANPKFASCSEVSPPPPQPSVAM